MKIKLEDNKWEIAINALKEINEKFSPIDKINCIAKCQKILQEAISFSMGKDNLGFEDIIQPFVYAMIKACPKNIISNYNYCELYLIDVLRKKDFGSSLSQFSLIITFIKEMKYDDLVGITEEEFGMDEIEEITK